MLDVRRLRILVVVAEEGSFTAAAQRLHLTQSAVSQQMSLLEREVGTSLLHRGARGVQLTPAGEFLADRARTLHVDILALEQEMRAFGDRPHEIRLGAFGTAGAELLPLALRTFVERNPNVRVRLSTVRAIDAVQRVRDGDIQALLTWDYDIAPRTIETELTQTPLPDDPLRVVLPTDHALAGQPTVDLAALAADRWIVRSHNAQYADIHEVICHLAGFKSEATFHTDDYPSLLGLVAAGVGVGLVPRMSLLPRRHDVAVSRLGSPEVIRRIRILTLPEWRRLRPLADLVDTLRSTAEHLHAEADGDLVD